MSKSANQLEASATNNNTNATKPTSKHKPKPKPFQANYAETPLTLFARAAGAVLPSWSTSAKATTKKAQAKAKVDKDSKNIKGSPIVTAKKTAPSSSILSVAAAAATETKRPSQQEEEPSKFCHTCSNCNNRIGPNAKLFFACDAVFCTNVCRRKGARKAIERIQKQKCNERDPLALESSIGKVSGIFGFGNDGWAF